MNYQLRQVTHETDYGGTETFRLHFHYGRSEATVTVTKDGVEINAMCEELPADSHIDEMVIETIAESWTDEYAGAMGDVGKL